MGSRMRQLAVETVLSLAVHSVHILKVFEILVELLFHDILSFYRLLQLICCLGKFSFQISDYIVFVSLYKLQFFLFCFQLPIKLALLLAPIL